MEAIMNRPGDLHKTVTSVWNRLTYRYWVVEPHFPSAQHYLRVVRDCGSSGVTILPDSIVEANRALERITPQVVIWNERILPLHDQAEFLRSAMPNFPELRWLILTRSCRPSLSWVFWLNFIDRHARFEGQLQALPSQALLIEAIHQLSFP
jgi:hypothetical protein